jgi:hypothetical protein
MSADGFKDVEKMPENESALNLNRRTPTGAGRGEEKCMSSGEDALRPTVAAMAGDTTGATTAGAEAGATMEGADCGVHADATGSMIAFEEASSG